MRKVGGHQGNDSTPTQLQNSREKYKKGSAFKAEKFKHRIYQEVRRASKVHQLFEPETLTRVFLEVVVNLSTL